MIRSIRLLTLCAIFGLVVVIPMANAKQSVMIGTYFVVASDSCQNNNVGFYPYPNLQERAPSNTVLATWESTMVFLDNGQVHETSTGQYALPGIYQPVGNFTNICQYTSTENPDGSFTLNGECNSVVQSGIGKDQTSNIKPISWRVVKGSHAILLSSIGTQVQTQTISSGLILFRICQGHGIGVQ